MSAINSEKFSFERALALLSSITAISGKSLLTAGISEAVLRPCGLELGLHIDHVPVKRYDALISTVAAPPLHLLKNNGIAIVQRPIIVEHGKIVATSPEYIAYLMDKEITPPEATPLRKSRLFGIGIEIDDYVIIHKKYQGLLPYFVVEMAEQIKEPYDLLEYHPKTREVFLLVVDDFVNFPRPEILARYKLTEEGIERTPVALQYLKRKTLAVTDAYANTLVKDIGDVNFIQIATEVSVAYQGIVLRTDAAKHKVTSLVNALDLGMLEYDTAKALLMEIKALYQHGEIMVKNSSAKAAFNNISSITFD